MNNKTNGQERFSDTKHQQTHTKSYNIQVKKVTLWQGISITFALLLVASIVTGGFGISLDSKGTATKDAILAQPTQPKTAPNKLAIDMKDLEDDDAVKGNPNAPVSIIEFGDFECPFCGRFYRDTLGQIEDKYIKTGKVKFIYRDFPLSFHANAQKAAEAAECAGEQGEFWKMHDKLFNEGVSGGVSSFKQFAIDIGLDATEFNDCLDSNKMALEVKKDIADGKRVGIRGTPGFVINGQVVSGAQPFANFQKIIEDALGA